MGVVRGGGGGGGRRGGLKELQPPPPIAAAHMLRSRRLGPGRRPSRAAGPAGAGSGEGEERKALHSGRRRHGNQECNGDQTHDR